MTTIKVAVVQSEPVWFNLEASVAKANRLIIEAHNMGAELIAFPEVFIPGYPIWLWSQATDFKRNQHYINNSLKMDSALFNSIVDTIKSHPINVVLGFSEREEGSVYISQCILNKEGKVVLKRRKVKATHVERVLFGDGSKQDIANVTELEFEVSKSNFALQVGCLNCWEHTQPLLTFNSASRHEKIHVGSWPAMFSHEPYSLSTEGAETLARAYAIQTQSFYLLSTAVISEEIHRDNAIDVLPEPMFGYGGGSSVVYAPDGRKISTDLGPQTDGLLFVELDMEEIVATKHLIDVVGHYSRPDLVGLTLH